MNRRSRPTLILGGGGQLGRAFAAATEGDVRVVGRDECDITQRAAVEELIGGILPGLTINCAAMTDVDRCEREPLTAGLVNAAAPGLIADACRRYESRMVQISTDFVFDGTAGRPYWEWDATGPVNVYGQTKLEGESNVSRHLPGALIVRTAWLFSDATHGFLKWVLSRQTDRECAVVNDQFGSPSAATDVARATLQLARDRAAGTVHVVNGGNPATRFDMAQLAVETIGAPVTVVPQASASFPRDAARPLNSSLATNTLQSLGYAALRDWREALAESMKVNR